jgi:NAD(P)-dependent dehydrogenase (short-subunit alcohol dehydrogenase family)
MQGQAKESVMTTHKHALITGAGSGIGRAAAVALAKAGWAVTLTGRRSEKLIETAALCPEGAPVLVEPADVSKPEDVTRLFETAYRRFNRLDLLFNNAGSGAPPVPLEDLTFEQWQGVVSVNLTGVFLCTQAAFRIMKDQDPRGGRIINNGSISADRPRPNSAPYTATKHAVSGLTKASSLDGRKYDIAVGQIDIGNADTELMVRAKTTGLPQANGEVVHEPMMDVSAVADAILYMSGLPLSANVQFMTVMATKMPLIGRG